MFAYSSGMIVGADIKIPAVQGELESLQDKDHDALLEYLINRIKLANSTRSTRIARYARTDKLVSTWQKLSPEDTERELKEDNTGRQSAIAMNLPILSSYLEDFTAFFAEVFAPMRRDFYVTPESPNGPNDPGAENTLAIVELGRRMNRDTKSRGYYSQVCLMLRALAKYNVGGVAIRWEAGTGIGELSQPGNRIEALDMYNYLWDVSVTDVAKIRTEAEWAARVSIKNQMWLERKALRGELQRVNRVLDREKSENYNRRNSQKQATFYRSAPTHVGLSQDGRDAQSSTRDATAVNWESYGAGLEGDSLPEVHGFEIVEMYCWLNPWQFKLVPKGQRIDSSTGASADAALDERGQGYQLWRFIIVDATQVVFAERVTNSVSKEEPEIPHYLAFLTHDDMREAQRSIIELLKPFQRFASFLMNIYVAGARKNIWGTTGVDPSMFDTSQLEHGEVAGILKSKTPGRDVRQGLLKLDSTPAGGEAMPMLAATLEIMRNLFPSQAMPSQIAGIDRAVKNQVAAVLQGVHRRLHMVARVLDSNCFSPMRLQCYRNLATGDADGLEGLTEESVANLLGSGLQSLNAEAAAEQLREVIFGIIQNQEAMVTFDIKALFTYWSQLLNLPTDLGSFVKQPAAAAPGAQPAATPTQPPAPGGIPSV